MIGRAKAADKTWLHAVGRESKKKKFPVTLPFAGVSRLNDGQKFEPVKQTMLDGLKSRYSRFEVTIQPYTTVVNTLYIFTAFDHVQKFLAVIQS